MADEVGVAILGSGLAGRIHALAARAVGARLVGILGLDAARADAAAVELGAEQGFDKAVDLIWHPAVEVVHICTPNSLHVPLAEMALDAGKHVICEKPLATSVSDAARLAAVARQSGLVAAVCFSYRFQSMAQEARERVRSGELGPVRLLHGSYLQDWLLYETDANWRTVSGTNGASRAFADIGSHWCDLAEWISGHKITALSAVTSVVHERRPRPSDDANGGGDLVEVDTEDAACMAFRASDGVVGSLTVSQVSPGRKNRLWIEIDGAQSSLVFDQENSEWLWIGSRQANQVIARDGASAWGHFPYSSSLPAGHARGLVECFAELFSNVYGAVRDEPRGEFPTFEDGLRSTLLTEAVLASAGEQRWVQVP
ncbi:MAG: Gfo/Idh/MocA family oxidoreductase [Acidimicrobiales bacterium]